MCSVLYVWGASPDAHNALTMPRDPTTEKRRNERGMDRAQLPDALIPSRDGGASNPPGYDALRASPRNDHPDAHARRRGHPWPLVPAAV